MKVDVKCWFCEKMTKVSGSVALASALNAVGWGTFILSVKNGVAVEGAACKDCCEVFTHKRVGKRGTIISLGHSAGMYSGKETLGGEGIVIAKKK